VNSLKREVHRGPDGIVVGFTTNYEVYSIQFYVTKFVN